MPGTEKTGKYRDYSKATGQLGLESQRRGSEMSQNAGSEEAERHGTRFSALFLGILSTQSRVGPGCLATVSKYMVVLRTRLGRVGYRHLDGSYRIRVEPETVGRAPLARLLTRSRGWKQPGDDGQNRYSTEVQEEQLSGALSLAILALEPRGNDAEVNPSLSPNDQQLISRLLHTIELRREGKRDITE